MNGREKSSDASEVSDDSWDSDGRVMAAIHAWMVADGWYKVCPAGFEHELDREEPAGDEK